jgi:hypothetical protein
MVPARPKTGPCPLLGPSGSSLGSLNLRQNESDQQLSWNLRLVVQMHEEPVLVAKLRAACFLSLSLQEFATTHLKEFGIGHTCSCIPA